MDLYGWIMTYTHEYGECPYGVASLKLVRNERGVLEWKLISMVCARLPNIWALEFPPDEYSASGLKELAWICTSNCKLSDEAFYIKQFEIDDFTLPYEELPLVNSIQV